MHKDRIICKSEGCKTTRRKSKDGKHYTSLYCSKCIKRKYRAKNPMQAAFTLLKSNAKKRGKEFTITFEYFKKFCFKTEYIKKKGKTAKSYSVDRKDDTKGYVPGNLQVLTLSQNTIKKAVDAQKVREEEIYKTVIIGGRGKKDDEVVPF